MKRTIGVEFGTQVCISVLYFTGYYSVKQAARYIVSTVFVLAMLQLRFLLQGCDWISEDEVMKLLCW